MSSITHNPIIRQSRIITTTRICYYFANLTAQQIQFLNADRFLTIIPALVLGINVIQN